MTEPHGTDDAQCRLLVGCIQRPLKRGTQVVLLGDYLGLLFARSCWGWIALGQVDRPIQVALADGPALTTCRQPLLPELTQGLEHPVAGLSFAILVGYEHGPSGQQAHHLENPLFADRTAGTDAPGGVRGTPPRKAREPVEEDALLLLEQVVAPGDSGFECALAGHGRPRAAREQVEAVIQPGRQFLD